MDEAFAQQIKRAIGAHGMWKTRLKQAIATGKSEFDPATVARDDACEFGQWLASVDGGHRSDMDWTKVRESHAAFHRAAADVLRLALSGHADQANAAMQPGAPFAEASTACTATMLHWEHA